MTERPSLDFNEQMLKALVDDSIPKLYGNGFVISIGTGDIVFLIKRNDQPVAVFNFSYTVSKTLAEKLGALIVGFEHDTGQTMMTTDFIAKKLSEERDEQQNGRN